MPAEGNNLEARLALALKSDVAIRRWSGKSKGTANLEELIESISTWVRSVFDELDDRKPCILTCWLTMVEAGALPTPLILVLNRDDAQTRGRLAQELETLLKGNSSSSRLFVTLLVWADLLDFIKRPS